MKNDKELSFETALNELQDIVNKLEAGEASLDESLKLFEKGIKLTAFCNQELKTAELKIVKLQKLLEDEGDTVEQG